MTDGMKKKLVVLSVVFAMFLGIGLWFNLQQGLHFGDRFWRMESDGRYASYGDWVSYDPDEGFRLYFAGQELTAQLIQLDDNRTRLAFSDGIAVETTAEDSISFEIGGIIWGGGMEYVITDMDAERFRFAEAMPPIHEPIYDENGNEIGEYILVQTADEKEIDYREVFYDHPEWSGPERETMILRNGTRLTDSDLSNKLFQNEQGEYLLEPERFAMIETSTGAYYSRGYVARFMLEAANCEPQMRGEAVGIVFYVIFYLLGAAGFLFPEQMALFGQRWKYQTPLELSDEGRFATMAGSVVIMGGSIVLLFMGL